MKRSTWRCFPLVVAAGIGVTVVANLVMVFAALDTFPGKAGDEGFALSNHYDTVLAQTERDQSLGWSVAARMDAAGRPTVALSDRTGAPLRGAAVTAFAERPLGLPTRQQLVFRETDAGRYTANAALPTSGQWDLTLSASLDGHDIAATRRVIVR